MNNQTPEIREASIVLVGHFNPRIFRPDWFADRELIGKEESSRADIKVIHPEIVMFSTDWLNIEVRRTLFVARARDEPMVKLHDLVLGCFERLKDTPIGQLGINRSAHFDLGDVNRWHNFGDKLVPKAEWDKIFERPPEPRWGGLKSLTTELDLRDTNYLGYTQVKVEPSPRFKQGILIGVNDHYQIEFPDDATGCNEIMEMLANEWQHSFEQSGKYINKLMQLV